MFQFFESGFIIETFYLGNMGVALFMKILHHKEVHSVRREKLIHYSNKYKKEAEIFK
jgi:hypothetical protein